MENIFLYIILFFIILGLIKVMSSTNRDGSIPRITYSPSEKTIEETAYSEKDANHLEWLFERMVNVHGENPNYDYMIRFRKVIETFKKNKCEKDILTCTNDQCKCKHKKITAR